MQVTNTNAKIPYVYNRYWYTELTDETLTGLLFTNAYKTKNRHKRIELYGNKNGKGISYFNICCGFDCETYTDTIQERAYMYIWQFSVNNSVIKGRTYMEFIELLDRIKTILKPNATNRLLVFIHNMSYEFSFFRGWLNLNDANQNFLKEERSPLKLTHDNFIEFRDSMALVGGDSLKGLAKKYTNTQKCAGDLDYSIPRNFLSKLDPIEESYCDNDVLILSEFARWVFDNLMQEYTKLPMTQTGILTNECKYLLNDMYYGHTEKWHENNIKRSPSDAETYTVQSNFLYRGGFTHASVDIIEEELTDLLGVDITSSYPYCMTQKIFPKQFVKVGSVPVSRVVDDIKNGYVSIFIASFRHLKSKGLHSIESKHKCLKLSQKATIDNGRVYYAEEITVYLTSFDFINYQNFYTWDGDPIITAYEVSETRYLYKHIVKPMLKYYKDKAVLKAQGQPYAIPKAKVNSFYGMCVKRQNGEMTKYDNNGFSTDDAKPYDEQLKNSIVCFYDGVFISAYARYRLLTLAYDVYSKFGIQSVYCDTDSHKFLKPTEELIKYISTLNEKIERNNVQNIEYFTNYDKAYSDLGCWDVEYKPMSMYDATSKDTYIARFKTLGAKRYIIELDTYNKETQTRQRVLNQTVAGLPKGEMLKQYGTIDECFNKFSDKMIITGCKLYSKYIDEPYEITVTDNQGNTDTHIELSCNALLPSNFSLTIDEIWKSWYIEIAEERQNDNREKRIL